MSGEIADFSQDVGLDRCKETEDEYLTLRLLALESPRRQKILTGVLAKIDHDEAAGVVAAAGI